MITCDQITVSYGRTIAAERVTFDVGPGEILGLLGPNGAGKTSVIRALTTILEPTSGSAWIDGCRLTDAPAVRSRIGVLPESSGYPTARSAHEVLRFHGRLFGMDRSAAMDRADELLELVGLHDQRDARVSTFSRGMRQRLGIARALMNRPRALFLDEPTLGLDPAGKQEILTFLREEAIAGGGAVVLCSHLLDEVERVCDRVAIMHEGRVVADGSVAAVVASARVLGGARVDVRPPAVPTTVEAINEVEGMRATCRTGSAGRIDVDFKPNGPAMADLAHELGRRRLDFTALEARGARLSDAFLQLTGATGEVLAS
ncbi:MAG: ABC transporter ATP-binding protein [Acidimicrobiales bacterium]|nr:MAG: ABC transporter ATP-binding protein [Acidimicrobiales bacterium]